MVKRRTFEPLNMSYDARAFENQIVPTVVYLWFENFQAFDTRQPHMPHDLTGE